MGADSSQPHEQLMGREVLQSVLRRQPIAMRVADLLENDHPFLLRRNVDGYAVSWGASQRSPY